MNKTKKDNLAISLGIFLKSKREEKGMTLAEVQDKLGKDIITPSTLSRMEDGRIDLTQVSRFVALCYLYDIGFSTAVTLYAEAMKEKKDSLIQGKIEK